MESHPQHYLFAYDIGCDKRRYQVHKCLKEWRIDGQYSVHETMMLAHQAEALAGQAFTLVQPQADALVLAKLDARGEGPCYHWRGQKASGALASNRLSANLPANLPEGHYLLAYDIRDPKRLQLAHRLVAKQSIYLQRSLYYYHGAGNNLMRLLDTVSALLHRNEDDLRLYRINQAADIWFICGRPPALSMFQAPSKKQSFWSRLWRRTA